MAGIGQQEYNLKGLRRFFETGNAKGLVGAERLRKTLAFIDAAESFEELSMPANFGLHELTGDRNKAVVAQSRHGALAAPSASMTVYPRSPAFPRRLPSVEETQSQ